VDRNRCRRIDSNIPREPLLEHLVQALEHYICFLGQISSAATAQLTLFGAMPNSPAAWLDALVDQVNHRYGSNTLRYGSMGFQQQWRMRQNRKSRVFTTRWEELLLARP